MGCGKSAVLSILKKNGWDTIDSDHVVQDILRESSEVKEAILARFGSDVFCATGSIDRSVLASYVFNNRQDLLWLEGIIHPLVEAHWSHQTYANPQGFWAIEVPLLFEAHFDDYFDRIACVAVSPEIQRNRLQAKGYSAKEISIRLESQMSQSRKIKKSDFILLNAASLSFLESQVASMIRAV